MVALGYWGYEARNEWRGLVLYNPGRMVRYVYLNKDHITLRIQDAKGDECLMFIKSRFVKDWRVDISKPYGEGEQMDDRTDPPHGRF